MKKHWTDLALKLLRSIKNVKGQTNVKSKPLDHKAQSLLTQTKKDEEVILLFATFEKEIEFHSETTL